ncbi:Mut7-C RNAse domain-containing protein [Fodinibius saliphilus]|uniref:Mut7-C RNAse domain-containing protein n=1 Tax=Fodinibius saliphilus TaxID=1920650 RepID=UPI001108007E|nr:Mut7-C RNAse domain-containing protein [Fodinibius saliphilus]
MIKQANLRPIGSLQDFINKNNRPSSTIIVPFSGTPSAKDLVESQGIPHTAISHVKINGMDKPLTFNLSDGDKVTVYPFEEVANSKVPTKFKSPERFIADIHLGKLTKTLRLLGFDTCLNAKWKERDIIRISNEEERMILTRDIGLLRHGDTETGYWIRNTDPDKQIKELFQRFKLSEHILPFSRCMECNGKLSEVALSDIQNRVPPKVQEWHSLFYQCQGCKKIYWKGSHFKDLHLKVEDLKLL